MAPVDEVAARPAWLPAIRLAPSSPEPDPEEREWRVLERKRPDTSLPAAA